MVFNHFKRLSVVLVHDILFPAIGGCFHVFNLIAQVTPWVSRLPSEVSTKSMLGCRLINNRKHKNSALLATFLFIYGSFAKASLEV